MHWLDIIEHLWKPIVALGLLVVLADLPDGIARTSSKEILVEKSFAILSVDPVKPNGESVSQGRREIRKWAVTVLEWQSGVKFSETARLELMTAPIK